MRRDQTLADIAADAASAMRGSTLSVGGIAYEFLRRNAKGLGVAALAVAGWSLYQGFSDPLPSNYISQPNFVAPGQDFYWGIKAYWMGVVSTAMVDAYLHPIRDAVILATGPVVQAVGRAVGSIKIHRER